MHQNGHGNVNSTSTFSVLKMAKRHLFFYVLCTACLTVSTLFILEYNGKYSEIYHLNFKVAGHSKENPKSDHQMELQDIKPEPVKPNLRSVNTKAKTKTKGRKKSGKNKKSREKNVNYSENSLAKIKFLSQETAQLSKEDNGKAAVLARLSEQFQSELKEIQNPKSSECTGKFLQCGYELMCGLGCSFHHHMGCLIFSYAMKIPLLHNEKTGWSYRDPWSKYFYSFGSKCKIDKNNSTSMKNVTLIRWSWEKFLAKNVNKSVADESQILSEGIPVPRKFGLELMKNHGNPFLWMIGQFIQVAFDVKEDVLKRIEDYEKSLGILNEDGKRTFPLIGMHVRRTDKYKETKFVFTPKNFMEAATEYREKWTKEQKLTLAQNYSSENGIRKSESESEFSKVSRNPWKIFIASEDYRVVSQFRHQFPGTPWEFVGDETSHAVQKNPASRRGHLYEIVRDIIVLSHCDYVICTVSSNVCRLLVDLAGLNRFHPTLHFKLLGGSYQYKLGSKTLPFELKLMDE